jgi:homogentisate 1,2-dioxygenase
MDSDELIFCTKGAIQWEKEIGNITLQSGEMFVNPKEIAHRPLPPADSTEENMFIELKIRGAISRLI